MAGTEAIAEEKDFTKLSPFELKDELIQVADESSKTRAAVMLNAGRGNPNWIAITPREAFLLFGQFALSESRRSWNEPDVGLAGMPKSPGIAARYREFLSRAGDTPGAQLLRDSLDYGIDELHFDPDKFVWEMTDAFIGDNYPVPDRMLVHAEQVVKKYLAKEMCDDRPPPGKFDLFAVEGGTAAMTYIFHSLVVNKILKKGDTIALGTPIFTPYLEIPHLEEFGFKVVSVEQSETAEGGRHTWQYPDSELDKLADPKVKAFFLVNPANPGAVAIRPRSLEYIVNLVRTKRPDLIILTDDVYGTFVNGFRSLAAELPHNTLLVYSYSKHFGCTGWRLGVIALHEDNVIDQMIARLPARQRNAVNKRYASLVIHPERFKFIDRIVADSRSVALNHTAGLSLPQQLQMVFFSLFALLDEKDAYKKRCQKICQDRLAALWKGLGLDLAPDELRSAYYQTLDLEVWFRLNMGEKFMEDLAKLHDPLDVVFGLARRFGTVLLNGSGFHGPPWSARVSLANLEDQAYPEIGKNLRKLAEGAIEEWRQHGGGLH
jgi:aspartate 4-decarboxylase